MLSHILTKKKTVCFVIRINIILFVQIYLQLLEPSSYFSHMFQSVIFFILLHKLHVLRFDIYIMVVSRCDLTRVLFSSRTSSESSDSEMNNLATGNYVEAVHFAYY